MWFIRYSDFCLTQKKNQVSTMAATKQRLSSFKCRAFYPGSIAQMNVNTRIFSKLLPVRHIVSYIYTDLRHSPLLWSLFYCFSNSVVDGTQPATDLTASKYKNRHTNHRMVWQCNEPFGWLHIDHFVYSWVNVALFMLLYWFYILTDHDSSILCTIIAFWKSNAAINLIKKCHDDCTKCFRLKWRLLSLIVCKS